MHRSIYATAYPRSAWEFIADVVLLCVRRRCRSRAVQMGDSLADRPAHSAVPFH